MAEKSQNRIITKETAESLIKAHDGSMALLCIYTTLTGCTDDEKAAGELCMTLADVKSAREKLTRAGLYPGTENAERVKEAEEAANTSDAVEVKEPKDTKSAEAAKGKVHDGPVGMSPDIPPYASEDVTMLTQADPNFKAVIDEAEIVFRRIPSSGEVKQLCGIYTHYGLPADVMFVLLHYCAEISSENSRKLTVNFIEKQALAWVELGITTAEGAEEYCEYRRQLRSSLGAAKSALDIRDRNLTRREEEYIISWLEMGFSTDDIYDAYDLTATKTGKRSWQYMNAILSDWHENGKDNGKPKPADSGKAPKINVSDTMKIKDKV